MDAATAAVVLILARRAGAVVIHDNDRKDNGKGRLLDNKKLVCEAAEEVNQRP